MNHNPGVKK